MAGDGGMLAAESIGDATQEEMAYGSSSMRRPEADDVAPKWY